MGDERRSRAALTCDFYIVNNTAPSWGNIICYAFVGKNICMIVILQFWAGSAKLYISGNHVIRQEMRMIVCM